MSSWLTACAHPAQPGQNQGMEQQRPPSAQCRTPRTRRVGWGARTPARPEQLQHHGFNPPSWEETGSRPSCPPALWTRPSTSNPRSRMATARRPVIPRQLPPRTPQPSRPCQPSLVGFPVRTARQPCVHHDPLRLRHNIPTAYLPNPALETPPSRVTSVSSPLSVPSHFRSLGRPPFSLCPGRGTSIPRSPTRKSSRQSLPRSRRPRDYQHTAHGIKHRQHPAAR